MTVRDLIAELITVEKAIRICRTPDPVPAAAAANLDLDPSRCDLAALVVREQQIIRELRRRRGQRPVNAARSAAARL